MNRVYRHKSIFLCYCDTCSISSKPMFDRICISKQYFIFYDNVMACSKLVSQVFLKKILNPIL